MKKSKKVIPFHDPTATLCAAIEKLELFNKKTESGAKIIDETFSLKKILYKAYDFMAGIFSKRVRKEQQIELSEIKQDVLWAKDIAKSHFHLIQKFKQGDDQSQQKIADWALETIKKYNHTILKVQQEKSWTSRYAVYMANELLLDEEIKGKQIEVPVATYSVVKSFKELSQTLVVGASQKKISSFSTSHKKIIQVMEDVFRLKAIRKLEGHFLSPTLIPDVLKLIKSTPIEIEKETESEISMQQVVEIAPGFTLTFLGSFERYSSEAKLMSIPILKGDSFHLTSKSIHNGFPYPAQHMGWALPDRMIPSPLRSEQLTLFSELEKRKHRISQALFFDSHQIAKGGLIAKLNKEVFDQKRSTFLMLHLELQEAMIKSSPQGEKVSQDVLTRYYSSLEESSSSFEKLASTQQQFIQLFAAWPASKLEEAWLEPGHPLRIGSSEEKYQIASQLMQEEEKAVYASLPLNSVINEYLYQMGQVLSPAIQTIILKSMSEKIGFNPPFLNDFEQKLQICAYQQLLSFLDQMEHPEEVDKEKIEKQLYTKIANDIKIFKNQDSDANLLNSIPHQIFDELETYFNHRFQTNMKNGYYTVGR